MTNLDTGTYGAKFQTWERDIARELLKEIVGRHPDIKDDDELFKFFWDEMGNHPEREAIIKNISRYWFANNLRSLYRPHKARERAQAREEIKQEREIRIKQHVERAQKEIHRQARLMFLDMVLPNGKFLRDCTGRDCLKLAPKVGPFLKRLGGSIKPNQIVGSVYATDAEIKKFWK